jgi:hypothetical protein
MNLIEKLAASHMDEESFVEWYSEESEKQAGVVSRAKDLGRRALERIGKRKAQTPEAAWHTLARGKKRAKKAALIAGGALAAGGAGYAAGRGKGKTKTAAKKEVGSLLGRLTGLGKYQRGASARAAKAEGKLTDAARQQSMMDLPHARKTLARAKKKAAKRTAEASSVRKRQIATGALGAAGLGTAGYAATR